MLNLSEAVPPQVFGFIGRINDGVWQAIFTVEVFGLVAQRVDLTQKIASEIIERLPLR
ncbi:hypothetical protein ALP12_200012 [Pseudomonas savastanoi pv. phaseolicola]|nr:hypothetical protein ALP12_200012 [Pseudomonas savastanoi pv. phaseolicola]